ncbi:MAG: extracellular solute-binding protein, partial [Micrococcales bacterium]|nr:extracellular solute-binding protein [Micrococcales bacterium]
MNARKSLAVSAVAALAVIGLAACSSSPNTSTPAATTAAPAPTEAPATTEAAAPATTAPATGTDSGTLTIWENNTNGTAGPAFWTQVVSDYKTVQPGVTLNVVPVQNEDMDGKITNAMNAGTLPEVFFQRGGGQMVDQVNAGQLADLTSALNTPNIPDGAFAAHTVNGKKYALPMSIQPGGFFYSKTLFSQAGITATPTSIDELNQDVTALKAAKITPIALGAKDLWPAAHWFFWFAIRECSQDTWMSTMASGDISDPCYLKAATDLQTFAATNPFNSGFLTTAAQQGAGSSAGLVANHKAAMELMGFWDPGVIGSLTPDQKPLSDLGFFPFPAVTGGQGDPSATMASIDSFACSAKAPEPNCNAVLSYPG